MVSSLFTERLWGHPMCDASSLSGHSQQPAADQIVLNVEVCLPLGMGDHLIQVFDLTERKRL